jgi:hypothetical protein
MRDHWQILLEQLDHKEGETIIDIGGAMDPVPIADMVVDIINMGKGGKNYHLTDLNSHSLPFQDDEFDVCICSQTLEDLCSPLLILSEMQRVAKRGVIEVPHRGPESLKNLYYNTFPKPAYAMDEVWHFGTGHHKWLIEELDGKLVFTPKIQYMLMRHPIPQWSGPGGITYFWNGNIDFVLYYDVFEEEMDRNYSEFRSRSSEHWS